MKSLSIAALALMLGTAPAWAFGPFVETIVERYKADKLVAIEDIQVLQRESQRWCYFEADGACAWSDIYLDVGPEGASYEISNAWDAERDVAFVDQGEFRDGRYICETGFDWVPSTRATRRSDGTMIGGRELAAFKLEITAARVGETQDCFDYQFVSFDAANQTVTLRQRQYIDEVTSAANDALVTLHFDADSAEALTLAW